MHLLHPPHTQQTRHVEVGAAQAPLPPALHDFVALRLAPRIPGSQVQTANIILRSVGPLL